MPDPRPFAASLACVHLEGVGAQPESAQRAVRAVGALLSPRWALLPRRRAPSTRRPLSFSERLDRLPVQPFLISVLVLATVSPIAVAKSITA